MKKYKISPIPKYIPFKNLKKEIQKQLENNFKLIFKPGNKNAFVQTDGDKILCNFFIKKKEIFVEEVEFKEVIKTRTEREYTGIKDVVAPYNNIPYEEQIEIKRKKLQREFKNRDIEIHPVENFFRNKFEFTFGFKDNIPLLGFRTGAFTKNMNSVDFASDIPFIPPFLTEKIIAINEKLQPDFIFDRENKTGFLKFLLVRISREEKIIALLSLTSNPSDEVNNFIANLPFKNLYVKFDDDIFEGIRGTDIEKIRGDNFLTERVNNFTFEISFFSFFQTNIECFEKIISYLQKEISHEEENILDLCCGTATIGILLAEKVQSIIGIEINEECKTLAYRAMEVNGISNYTYHISDLLKFDFNSLPDKSYIAILDPPRAGVHKKIIQKIRELNIRKLIFIACDYKQVKSNIEDLQRKESNTYRGDPFTIKSIAAFDMFPNTPNVETVIIFER